MVSRQVAPPPLGTHGGNVDDPPPTLRDHLASHSAAQQEDSLAVGVEYLVPAVLPQFQQRSQETAGGVVDQDVNAPKLSHRGLHQVLYLLVDGDVRHHRQGLS